ncbi:MAG: YeeE/YedE thiosulfate transporter family protein [Nitrospirota bacterium]|nr:YeeE/YedE thiosulfate transporter family protein [Nitrospirota bacterium]
MEKNNFWSPYIAGVGLGLTLLATFYIIGWGLGASSAYSLVTAVGLKEISPDYAGSLKYFSRYLNVESPLKDWVLFEVTGLFIGALTGALLSGNFRVRLDKAAKMSTKKRLITAVTGGILIGFASRLSRGCTSGVALSGGAQLAAGGWIFVIAMFAGGFVFAALFRRLW